MRRRTFLATVPAVALASAAQSAQPAQPALPRGSFVDDAGRSVAVPSRVRVAFPGGAPAAMTIYCLAPDRLAGWTRALRPEEAAFLLPEVAKLPELGRLSGRGSTAKLEALVAMRADLVVDVGAVTPTYASLADQVQQQARVPCVLLDGSFDQVARTLSRLGGLLGVADRGERLAAEAQRILAEAEAAQSGVPEARRPRVLFARGPTGLATAADGGLNAEVLEAVGAVNVAKLGAPNLAQISYEQALLWDPDWLIVGDAALFAQMPAHPFWSRLRAVRERRALLVPKLPFGWFDSPPALNRLLGVMWLSATFFPERAGQRLEERVADFHELFFHRRPSAAQVSALLAATRLPPRP